MFAHVDLLIGFSLLEQNTNLFAVVVRSRLAGAVVIAAVFAHKKVIYAGVNNAADYNVDKNPLPERSFAVAACHKFIFTLIKTFVKLKL